MRAGGYTVHHSLTAEAAAVLKLSLSLARRRGHAQVTPLHVAFTLLSGSSTSPSSAPAPQLAASDATVAAYGLLRRACVRSHPACSQATTTTHPLRCRALELCFNVALNRLPTTGVVLSGGPLMSASSSPASSFSASLVQPNPTLSNALVAALKRAQANQRRGCIELQSQQPPPTPEQQQQQPPPFLALKVELDQLVISILDDPSVSRVMREAGFSSASVKSSIEEESAMLLLGIGRHTSSPSHSPAEAIEPQILLEPYVDFPTNANGGGSGPWPGQFLNLPDGGSSCTEEDVNAILEVMARKEGRRTNPVVVGDSVSIAEASITELIRRLELGDVPDELRGAHVLSLHLSYAHVGLMPRADVYARVAELRRSVETANSAKAAGVIIYVGDMRWAVDEDGATVADAAFSPVDVEHMVAELACLLAELRATARGRAWLLAAASYQTYMRCQQRRRTPPLETAWALQPVIVPIAGGGMTGLALGPCASTATPPLPAPRGSMLGQVPLFDLAAAAAEEEEEGHAPALCAECTGGYEKDASLVRAKAEGTTLALAFFPGWPQADEPRASHEDELMELRRRWSRLCRSHRNEPAPSAAGLCLSFGTPISDHVSSRSRSSSQDANATLSLMLPGSMASPDEEVRGGAESADDTVSSGDRACARRAPWLDDDELPAGHVKRKAEGGLQSPGGEPKRPRGCCGGLDLNFCAAADDEEENGDGGDSDSYSDSEGDPAPSDLTNAGESSGDTGRRHGTTTRLDSSRCRLSDEEVATGSSPFKL